MNRQPARKLVWTDMPFAELGDNPMAKGPVREVLLIKVGVDGTSSVQLPSGSICTVKNNRLHMTPEGLYN